MDSKLVMMFAIATLFAGCLGLPVIEKRAVDEIQTSGESDCFQKYVACVSAGENTRTCGIERKKCMKPTTKPTTKPCQDASDAVVAKVAAQLGVVKADKIDSCLAVKFAGLCENEHGRKYCPVSCGECPAPKPTATLAPACTFEKYDQQVVYAKHLNSADTYSNYCTAFDRGPCKTEFCQGGGNTACRDECIPRTLKPTTVAKPVKPTTVAKPTAKPVKPTTVAKPTAKPVKPTFSGSIFSGSLFSGSLFSGSLFSGSLFSGSIFHHERPTYWRSGAVETDIQADQKWTWNTAEDQNAQLLN